MDVLETGRHSLDNPRFVTNGGDDPICYSPQPIGMQINGETEISEWAHIIHVPQAKPVGGTFKACTKTTGDLVGELNYFFLNEEHTEIQFQDVTVEEPYRRRRVATALLRKLNLVYPEARINPGTRTVGGQAFMDHILATEPDKVATNGILNVPLQLLIPPGFRPMDTARRLAERS